MYQSLVIMDVETGGLSSNKNPITQIGLLALNENYETIKEYETFVKPYAGLEILDRALEASRVTMTDIHNGIEIQKAVKEVSSILKGLLIAKRNTSNNRPILIGHNINFDIGFLSFAFQMFQLDFMSFFYPIPIDTITMMKRAEIGVKLEKGARYNLTSCVQRLGLNDFNAHGAMDDVYATAEVYKVLEKRLRNKGEGMVDDSKKNKARKFFDFCDF